MPIILGGETLIDPVLYLGILPIGPAADLAGLRYVAAANPAVQSAKLNVKNLRDFRECKHGQIWKLWVTFRERRQLCAWRRGNHR